MKSAQLRESFIVTWIISIRKMGGDTLINILMKFKNLPKIFSLGIYYKNYGRSFILMPNLCIPVSTLSHTL